RCHSHRGVLSWLARVARLAGEARRGRDSGSNVTGGEEAATVTLGRPTRGVAAGASPGEFAMSDSPDIAVVRRLDEARGNPEVIRQVLANEVRWEVVDGFPYGGIYVGLDSVVGDFFGRLFTDFDEFVANGSEFFESGARVIALGSYSGRARRSGKTCRLL